MHVAAFIGGLFCSLGVALDAFQTIILPRRPTGRFQLTRIFLIASWAPWVVMAEHALRLKVAQDQADALAHQLVLTNAQLENSLSARSTDVRRAQEYFSVRRLVTEVEALYEQAMAGPVAHRRSMLAHAVTPTMRQS